MNQEDMQKLFVKALQSEGIKLTPQRQAIFSNIINSEGHRECNDIHQSLIEDGIDVSRATIYRTLDVLAKYEYIRKLDIGDGKIRYEKKLGTSHHDHMICIETGDIIEFHNEKIENLQDQIARKHGYKIIRHVHQLFVKPIIKKK